MSTIVDLHPPSLEKPILKSVAHDIEESQIEDVRVEDFETTMLRYLRIDASLIASAHRGLVTNSAGDVIWKDRLQKGIFFRIMHAMKPWRSYAHKLFWELVTSFIAEPFLVLTSPIDAAALFVALPLCCFVFFYLSFLWQLFGQTPIGFKLADFMSKSVYTEELFQGNESIKLAARRSLGRYYEPSEAEVGAAIADPSKSEDQQSKVISKRLPCFSPINSEFLLLVAAATYARDLRQLKLAADSYRSYVARDGCPLPGHPILKKLRSQPSVYPEGSQLWSLVAARLKDSQAPLEKFAKSLGLQCSVASELNATAFGPCCALYWTSGDVANGVAPFIICAFNGTAPTAIDEWMLDASFQKVDSRAFLHGKNHAGFLTTLFPDDNGTTRGDDPILSLASAPYGRIAFSIRRLAKDLSIDGKPVPLWITGHSLGAAIASLIYARFSKCPEDLGKQVVLRDAYCFGTPATGDTDFAAGYSSSVSIPYDNPNTLWRVINDHDLICRVPLSLQTLRDGGVGKLDLPSKVLRGDSLLAYTPIGVGIRIFSDGRLPAGFSPTVDPLRVMYKDVDKLASLDKRPYTTHQNGPNALRKKGFPGGIISRFVQAVFRPIAKPLTDHSPIEYAASQRASRVAFDRLVRADVSEIIKSDIPLIR